MAFGLGEKLVCLGQIRAPHGVRGLLKLESYAAQPEDILAYGVLYDAAGRAFKLQIKGVMGDCFLVAVEGVQDRDAAAKLKGTKLFVPRSSMPAPLHGQYYLCDLEGLKLQSPDGVILGNILNAEDYGAGLVVMVQLLDGTRPVWPFSQAVFPEVDVAAGYAVAIPPLESSAEPLETLP